MAAAKRGRFGSADVLPLSMRSRVLTALAGAVLGTGLALLDAAYLASPNTGYLPQTTGGWFAFYVGLCMPWTLLGAVVGLVVGKRGKPNQRPVEVGETPELAPSAIARYASKPRSNSVMPFLLPKFVGLVLET